MAFLNALGAVFSLLIVIAIGFVLARYGWFSTDTRKLLPRLITNISLPPFMMYTIVQSMDREQLILLLYGALFPLLTIICTFVFAWIYGKALKVNSRHFGLFCSCVAQSNAIFIGIPVNISLFGNQSVPYALLYYFASTCFTWTVCNYVIAKDRIETKHYKANRSLSQLLNNYSPIPFFGFVCGVLIVYTELTVPNFIMESAKLIGEMTTPLALIFIGIKLSESDLLHIKLSKDLIAGLIGRMVISPLVVWIFLKFINLPDLMGKVFIMQASLPVMMQAAILSAYYNTDSQYGSLMVSLSTILSVITIPIYMTIL